MLTFAVAVAVFLGVIDDEQVVDKEQTAASISLGDAFDFHRLVQSLLPDDYDLEMRGFPRRKWVRGLEPFGNTRGSLGSWSVVNTVMKDGREIRLRVLELRLIAPKMQTPVWRKFGVVIEGDESNQELIKLRKSLLSKLEKAEESK